MMEKVFSGGAAAAGPMTFNSSHRNQLNKMTYITIINVNNSNIPCELIYKTTKAPMPGGYTKYRANTGHPQQQTNTGHPQQSARHLPT
jgi:hypothetical protein